MCCERKNERKRTGNGSSVCRSLSAGPPSKMEGFYTERSLRKLVTSHVSPTSFVRDRKKKLRIISLSSFGVFVELCLFVCVCFAEAI